MKFIIGSKHHESTPGDSQGEEHLLGSLPPDGELQQLLELRDEQEVEALGGAVQHAAADEEGDQDHVGEGGREVDNLKKQTRNKITKSLLWFI